MGKAFTTFDSLSTIKNSDLSDKKKNKLEFFQAVAVSVLLYGCTIWAFM